MLQKKYMFSFSGGDIDAMHWKVQRANVIKMIVIINGDTHYTLALM